MHEVWKSLFYCSTLHSCKPKSQQSIQGQTSKWDIINQPMSENKIEVIHYEKKIEVIH